MKKDGLMPRVPRPPAIKRLFLLLPAVAGLGLLACADADPHENKRFPPQQGPVRVAVLGNVAEVDSEALQSLAPILAKHDLLVGYADGEEAPPPASAPPADRKSTRLNSSHSRASRMPSSA